MKPQQQFFNLTLIGIALLGLSLIALFPLAFYFAIIEPNSQPAQADTTSVDTINVNATAAAEFAADLPHAPVVLNVPGEEATDEGASMAGEDASPEDRTERLELIAANPESAEAGRTDYIICAACHGTQLEGGVGKPLVGSEFVRGVTDIDLINFIINGRTIWDEMNTTGVAMPARGGEPSFSDEDIAEIVSYIRIYDGVPAPEESIYEVAEPAPVVVVESVPIEDDEDYVFAPLDTSGIGSSTEAEDTTDTSTENTANMERGMELYNEFCGVDDASQAMCDYLHTITDEAELRDVLLNGTSPFDSSLPEGVSVPQAGGMLFFSDADIDALTAVFISDCCSEDSQEPVADDSTTENTADMERGMELYNEFCGVDDASQAMCDYLHTITDEAELRDVLLNGTSPFDSSLPEGVSVPQAGGMLFFSADDIDALTAVFLSDCCSEDSQEPVADDSTTENTADMERGMELYNEFCGVDDASQAMCDYLHTITDEAELRDVLLNGTSPFDSSLPEGVSVPQAGGMLFFTADDIDALTAVFLSDCCSENSEDAAPEDTEEPATEDTESNSSETSNATIGTREGRTGAEIYEAMCTVDDASQAMCDYLQSLATEDLANYDRMIELLTLGTSPFDRSIPEGISVPQRGNTLLLTDNEILNLVDYLFAEAGFADNLDPLDVSAFPDFSENDERAALNLWADMCLVNDTAETSCEYLLSLIEDGTGRERIAELLTDGTSPLDTSIPQGIFLPQRGGDLLFNDQEVSELVDYAFSLIAAADEVDYRASLSYVGRLKGSVIFPHRQVGDFTAPSTIGDFTLSDYRGRTVVVYFGYMTCPDVCPTTLVDLMRAYRDLDEPSDNVTIVFVTIDPERDTLDLMDRYLTSFHADFVGIRPENEEQLQTLMADFGVLAQRREVDSSLGYLMDHSAITYIVGPDGRLVSQLPYGVPYTEISNDISVLAEYTFTGIDTIDAGRYVEESDPAREYRIVIPEGTNQLIMMGQDPGIIPLEINLTLGERDILVLENHDNADYLVGGIWVAPNETVMKQFYEAQTFVGLCTVTVGRDLVEIIITDPNAPVETE